MGDKLQDVPLQLYAGALSRARLSRPGRLPARRGAVAGRRRSRRSPNGGRARSRHGRAPGTAFQAITLAWLARCLAERGEFDESVDRRPPGGGPRRRSSAARTAWPAACIGLGYSLPRQGRPRRRRPRARAGLQRRPRGKPHAAASAGRPPPGQRLSPGRADRRGRGPRASGRGGGRVEAAPDAAGGRARIARRGLPLRRSRRRGIDRRAAGADPRQRARPARGCGRRAARARRGRRARLRSASTRPSTTTWRRSRWRESWRCVPCSRAATWGSADCTSAPVTVTREDHSDARAVHRDGHAVLAPAGRRQWRAGTLLIVAPDIGSLRLPEPRAGSDGPIRVIMDAPVGRIDETRRHVEGCCSHTVERPGVSTATPARASR